MARKGENIYKRKDGRWEARYEKGRNSKGQIIYGSLYGKSYREVKEKKINSIVKLPVTKTISPSESLNICDISTRWLESIRHTVKESTYSCYLTLIQKHILTYFNNSSMITSEHIQQFINYKITNGLSPTSVRNIVVLLERILRYGEDENLLPVTKRSFTFPKSSFYINDTLDASQLSILARYLYLEGDVFSVGLLLCMHTGIRIGELVNLNVDDIDLEGRECIVYGKGDKERRVYFDAKAKVHLKEYIEHRKDDNKALFVTLDAPYDRLKISGVEIRLRNLGRKLQLERIHPHKFRRSMATRAIDKGMPIEQVQKILGHSQIDTTMQYAMVNQNNVKTSHQKYLN